MALSTGKIAEVMFEKALDTHEHQMDMLDLVSFHQPDGGQMQNTGNFIWYPVEQHAPLISGWDLSGEETGIIEETYPGLLGTPSNDYVKMRADDMRTTRFWENRGAESGKKQATDLNKKIAEAIRTQGSLFYRSNVTSGYEFIAEAQAIMNERQAKHTQRYFMLNDRDTLLFSTDLAARQTLQGRPNDTWKTGQIGQNIAQFDVYTGSFLPNLTGGADPAITLTADHTSVPVGGTVNATTGVVTNVDYREVEFTVNDASLVNVGDKFTWQNTAVDVNSIGLSDKTNTGQAMTWTVIKTDDCYALTCYPKPIAADQTGITTLQAAYANMHTQILATATLTRLNIDASNKTNLFWDRSAIEVMGGTIPAELFKQFDGMKVITDTMSNGLNLYLVYDGNIDTMTFRFRLFTWYGITVKNPSNCGVAVTY